MTKIKKLVEAIDEEICGAKEYAEKYVEHKAAGNMNWANKFKEMANDELRHATILHDKATEDINELNKVFKPTMEMQKMWDDSHVAYVEKVAWIKQMLQM